MYVYNIYVYNIFLMGEAYISMLYQIIKGVRVSDYNGYKDKRV